MKNLIFLSLFLTGCASLQYKVVGWGNSSNRVLLNNGNKANIVGNPRITCYTKYGFKLGDGFFVTVKDNYLIVDEFGKNYVWLEQNDLGNYCSLWNQQ
jgi:hypothetical protein